MHIFDFYRRAEKREELRQLLIHASQHHQDGLPHFFLEKDLWVTEILRLLYDEKVLGDYSVAFKGGTALSKCWKVIDRFSEDIDLSIHWAQLAGAEDEDAAWQQSIKSRAQRDKFRQKQSKRLTAWSTQLVDSLNHRFESYGIEELRAVLDTESKGERVYIHYPAVTQTDHNYLLDHVLLEFGGRNRGQPTIVHSVNSYMSDIPEFRALEFPAAQVEAFHPDYILWEKLTALHQFSTMEREPNPHRLARHWYDVDRLLTERTADPISSVDARKNVVRMKSVRWEERGVNYELVLQGKLQLIPPEGLLEMLAKDHNDAIVGQLFFTNRRPDSFKEIIERLALAQDDINSRISAQ